MADCYLCERCGGTGQQPAGCWDGKAYAAPAGVCTSCGGTGYLGPIDRTPEKPKCKTCGAVMLCGYRVDEWIPQCSCKKPPEVPSEETQLADLQGFTRAIEARVAELESDRGLIRASTLATVIWVLLIVLALVVAALGGACTPPARGAEPSPWSAVPAWRPSPWQAVDCLPVDCAKQKQPQGGKADQDASALGHSVGVEPGSVRRDDDARSEQCLPSPPAVAVQLEYVPLGIFGRRGYWRQVETPALPHTEPPIRPRGTPVQDSLSGERMAGREASATRTDTGTAQASAGGRGAVNQTEAAQSPDAGHAAGTHHTAASTTPAAPLACPERPAAGEGVCVGGT